MRWTVGILSAATLGLMGREAAVEYAVLTGHPSEADRGLGGLFWWFLALEVGLFTLVAGIGASSQRQQFGWLAGLLAAWLVGILGAMAFLTLDVSANQILGLIAFNLPAGVGLVGLVYSFFMRAPAGPNRTAPIVVVLAPEDFTHVPAGVSFQLVAKATTCDGHPLAAAAVVWTGNGSQVGTGANLTTSLATPGVYTISVTSTDNGQSDTSTITLYADSPLLTLLSSGAVCSRSTPSTVGHVANRMRDTCSVKVLASPSSVTHATSPLSSPTTRWTPRATRCTGSWVRRRGRRRTWRRCSGGWSHCALSSPPSDDSGHAA
jgi:hypothetical protein